MSPIPLGILAASGAGAAGAMELIQTTVLGGAATEVTLSSIPQTFKHLQIRVLARSTTGNQDFYMGFNGASGTMHRAHYVYGIPGSGTSSGTEGGNGRSRIGFMQISSDTLERFSPNIIDILDYSNTAKNTTSRVLNARVSSQFNVVGLWSQLFLSTNAITSVTFSNTSPGQFAAGSRFSIFGIKG